jgi:hypothetical protein
VRKIQPFGWIFFARSPGRSLSYAFDSHSTVIMAIASPRALS